ncbi:maltase-glucoamylase, intestinal, partial [Nephila pilipes]
WDTSIGGLVLSDQFLQISSYLPSTNIYGLGEHTHETLRHDLDYKTWPMFARDRFPEGGPINLYGVHPYYTCLEKSSKSHGVLLLNSNAMDVTLLPAPGITFRTTGGIIDLFFLMENNPENLMELYGMVVGRPIIPPYWGLGFQLSRYGYNSLENVKNAVERTRAAGIAQDVQFLDIDHMEGNRDFTYDKTKFSGLIEYINKTRDTYGMKWIIILVMKSSGSERLSKMTLCMESIHSNRTYSFRHYDVHSLYGWSQSQPTLQGAQIATKARSLVISRSTYPSSGRYTGHWLGDNKSTWEDLRRSVIGMLEFNIFGIPYIGADVCGFIKDTTPELCKRWMQLGAFYPFFRNHNGFGQKEQDPAALGDEVKEASKRAVERRYTLNPYLYTLFYRAHVWGNTVVRPLFHEFPKDENTWNNGEQFMWGKCLLISPVLKEGENSVRMYLPATEWWHFEYTKSTQESRTGEYIVKGAADNIPLHVRGGCIIPTEDYKLKTSNVDLPKNFTFYVFPLKNEASGDIYIDGLNSIYPVERNEYELYNFGYKNCSLEIKKTDPIKGDSFDGSVAKIHVFKVKEAKNVLIGSESVSTFSLDRATNVLTINVNKKLADVQKITWDDGNKNCQMLP